MGDGRVVFNIFESSLWQEIMTVLTEMVMCMGSVTLQHQIRTIVILLAQYAYKA